MTSLGYIRVSTEEQAREGISLDHQRAKIEMYCQLNDLSPVKIIEDAGRSGKDLNRGGIQEIMSVINTGEVDSIIVYKLDRLSRRVKDTLSLMELFEKKKVSFHSISERIDTKTAMGKFFLNILASMNQWERDTISERTRDALRHKKSNGQRVGQVPYGWKVGADEKQLVEIPEEQVVIEAIRQYRKDKLTLDEICKRLIETGVKPLGSRWHRQTIANILNREEI